MKKERGTKMSSKNLRTVDLELSWGNIQDQIASLIHSMAKGKLKDNEEVVSLKLNYSGGYVPQDKIIPVEVIVRKGVSKVESG